MTRKPLYLCLLCLVLGVLPARLATAGTGSAGCPLLPQGRQHVRLDPSRFAPRIDNRYWPMAPGSRWIFRETETDGTVKRVVISVTSRTKVIMGIRATVVHDVVTEHGRLVENTWDWYAQDTCGNVWYLGEDTKEYRGGRVVSTKGSWQAGVDGAEPGVIVPGRPRDGLTYRQEYYAGEAEDAAEILSLEERAEVPFGRFTGALLTKEWTPLHPEILEYKLYAKGVGPVLILDVSGGSSREELVGFSRSS